MTMKHMNMKKNKIIEMVPNKTVNVNYINVKINHEDVFIKEVTNDTHIVRLYSILSIMAADQEAASG